MPFSDDEEIHIESISRFKLATLIISISLFVCSLFTIAFCTEEHCKIGIETLIAGPLALLGGKSGISWLANPFLWFAWFLLVKNKKIAWLPAFIASLFCTSFLYYKEIIRNEAGTYEIITTIRIGYWLWLASSIVCFVGDLVTCKNKH